MTKTLWFRALLALFSAGWLVPMWLGLSGVLQFFEIEMWPLLLQAPRGNSFPFLAFARDAFGVAFLWLGIVIVAWAWFALRVFHRSCE